MIDVVERMKRHDVSQLPVLDRSGALIGAVSEIDLLDHLLHADHVHDPEETIALMVNPNVITVSPDTKIDQVQTVLERGKIVAVTEGKRPVGILTKIDLIDYLAHNIR
jgi:cystathionine beta-synthase